MKTVGSFAVLATAALVTGYGNGTGPGLQVSLSFATRAPGTTAAPAFSVTGVLSDTVRSGNDVLVISQAQIVLRRIKVKLQETPLVISGSTSTNVAIRVVVRDWFKAASGAPVGPATADKGGANENLVKDNIKNSMRAFEDKNKDGDDRNG